MPTRPRRPRPVFLLLAVVLALAGCAPRQAATPERQAATRAEVRQALQVWSDTASRGDLPAFMALFDQDADIMLVGSDKGEICRGRAEAEKWVGGLLAHNRFGWTMEQVDIDVMGNTAWAFVDGKMVVKNAETGEVRFSTPYRYSAVLVRRGDGWAWRLFHGSIPRGE